MKNFILSLLLLAPLTAGAVPIILSGDFSATDTTSTSAVTQISGSWKLTYDDAGIALVGSDSLTTALTSFSMNPNPLGATAFDLTNTIAQLFFTDSALVSFFVGGNTTGIVGTVATDDDAFYLNYSFGQLFDPVVWSLASEPSDFAGFVADRNNISGTYSDIEGVVSEPASLALFGLGLAGIGFARRKRA